MVESAVITNRITLRAKNRSHEEAIVASLTYKLEDKFRSKHSQKEVYEVIKTFVRQPRGIFSIPIGRMDLVPPEYGIFDNRIHAWVELPEPKLPLRESQKAIYDHITDSCIINAPVSWGKSFMGLYICKKFKQKTLIITHTTAIRDQWIENVKRLYGIEPGVIGGGKITNFDSPIVVANIQTLVKHIEFVKDKFGMVILDEMHHVPASTFSNILDQMMCRYRIGLSGTVVRKDGKHILFRDFFGSVIYKPERENSTPPNILIVDLPIRLPPGEHWAHIITELNDLEPFRNAVVSMANEMADRGHKVLVVGDRVNFLNSCAHRSGDRAVVITGQLADHKERAALMKKISDSEADILYGSKNIFAEGVSLNELSCVVLASVINNDINLEQIIGRIQRICPGKKTPLVVDFRLQDNISKNQGKNRTAFYIKSGWKMFRLNKIYD